MIGFLSVFLFLISGGLFWMALEMVLPESAAFGWILMGVAGSFAWCALILSPTVHQVLHATLRRRTLFLGVLAIGVLCGFMAVVASRHQSPRDQEIAQRRQEHLETRDLLERVLEQVKKNYPGAVEVRPLTANSPSTETVNVSVGIVTLAMRLLKADEFEWQYGIDELKIGKNITFESTSLIVQRGQLVAVVSGKDLSLVVSVVELESGQKIPWIGLVPRENAPRMALADFPNMPLLK